jgi:hypothetical protein
MPKLLLIAPVAFAVLARPAFANDGTCHSSAHEPERRSIERPSSAAGALLSPDHRNVR